MKIVDIDPKLIDDHPLNEELYGPIMLEPAFVEHIERHGIRQNLIVTPSDKDGRFRAVSGHRRKRAAVKVGSRSVPCEVRTYATEEDEKEDLIALNYQRPKTEAMLAREVEELLRIESARAEIREKSGKKPPGPKDPGGGEEVGRAQDIVADRLNISRMKLRRLLIVFGDAYQREKIGEWRGDPVGCSAVIDRWDAIREERLQDKVSLTKAAAMIGELLSAAAGAVHDEPKARIPAHKATPLTIRFEPIGQSNGSIAILQLIKRNDLEMRLCTVDTPEEKATPAIMVGGRLALLPWSDIARLAGQEPNDGTA